MTFTTTRGLSRRLGLLFAALMLAACTPPAASPTPAPSASPTPVTTSTPTASPIPTVTSTPAPISSPAPTIDASTEAAAEPSEVPPPVFSEPPPTGRIVFANGPNGSRTNLDSISADGTDRLQLTHNYGTTTNPVWSPYADQIAYESDVFAYTQIFIMAADGSNQRQVTSDDGNHFDPAWSPDQAQLAFSGYIYDDASFRHNQIYVIDVEAGADAAQSITSNPERNFCPAWQPGGIRIAFMAFNRDVAKYRFGLVDAGGGALVLSDLAYYSCPVWSPDGKQLVYTRSDGGQAALVFAGPDGRETSHVPLGFNADSVTWSPDGAQIAFLARGDAASSIYVTDAHGGNLRLVSDKAYPDDHLTWSPDGRWIAFMTGGQYDQALALVSLSTGNLYLLTGYQGLSRPAWQPEPPH